MTLKNATNFAGWNFQMDSPDGQAARVPLSGNAKSRQALVSAVLAQMASYDSITNNEYTKLGKTRAAELNMSFADYIGFVVEHQICLRIGSENCWSSGLGDTIHSALGKVDDLISKMPEGPKKLAQSLIEKITPSRVTQFKGCSSCGGTKSYSPSKDNLGRAGRVNEII